MVAQPDDLAELRRLTEAGASSRSKRVRSIVDRLVGPPLADEQLGGPDLAWLPDPGSDDALSGDELAYEATQDAPETFGLYGAVKGEDEWGGWGGPPVDGDRATTKDVGRRFTRRRLASGWSAWELCCECRPTTRRTACCWMHENGDPHSCNPDTSWDTLLTHWSRNDRDGYRWRKAESVRLLAEAMAGVRVRGALVKIPEAIARSMTAGRQAVLGWPPDDIFRPLVFSAMGPDDGLDDGDWSSESPGGWVPGRNRCASLTRWDPGCFCDRRWVRVDAGSRRRCGPGCKVCAGPPAPPTDYSGLRHPCRRCIGGRVTRRHPSPSIPLWTPPPPRVWPPCQYPDLVEIPWGCVTAEWPICRRSPDPRPGRVAWRRSMSEQAA